MNDKLEDVMESVQDSFSEYNDILSPIIRSYSGDMDSLINEFNNEVILREASNDTLESFLFRFGVQIYQLSSKIEEVGMKEDISKVVSKEVYNKAYLNKSAEAEEKKVKLTVAQLTAMSEQEAKYESLVNMIYDRLYSEMKLKLNAAIDIVNSIRKIISRRMQEFDLSNSFTDTQLNGTKQYTISPSGTGDLSPSATSRRYFEEVYS